MNKKKELLVLLILLRIAYSGKDYLSGDIYNVINKKYHEVFNELDPSETISFLTEGTDFLDRNRFMLTDLEKVLKERR